MTKQKRTNVVEDRPGIWFDIASGYRTTMTEMIESDAVTVQHVRIKQGSGRWTSVDNWDGQNITGVRGTTHMAIVHRLREDE
ncbi:hypothetical protein [Halomicrococcus sp. SG-WS-1]|uniref:hypothetical protein n=1 Tax=Halomicrococcus sp. SG-WS-1 TaxID=3439057 RepID=UPI003F79BA3F